MNTTDAVTVGSVVFAVVVVFLFAVRGINRAARAPVRHASTGTASLGAMLLSGGSTGLALLAGISGAVSLSATIVFGAAGFAWLLASVWALRQTRRAPVAA